MADVNPLTTVDAYIKPWLSSDALGCFVASQEAELQQ